MKIIYNEEKLMRILNDFHILTGVSMSFIDHMGNVKINVVFNNDFCSNLQKSPVHHEKCANCDVEILEKCKQSHCFESHICHENLYDAALPVEKDGVFAGYILMGRIRVESSILNTDLENDEDLINLFNQIPLFSQNKIDALKSLLPEILFANAITVEFDPFIEQITTYISDNLDSELSVTALCKRFFISRNRLYKCFNEGLGCTVNEYIIKTRLSKAKSLLKCTSHTVENIAATVGIGNYTYFCKIFKHFTGVTPTEYRKSHIKKQKCNLKDQKYNV